MWKNIAEPGRPQMTIWLLSTEIWIFKTTNANAECLIRSTFPLQHWSHKGTSEARYTYIVCLVLNSMAVRLRLNIIRDSCYSS